MTEIQNWFYFTFSVTIFCYINLKEGHRDSKFIQIYIYLTQVDIILINNGVEISKK